MRVIGTKNRLWLGVSFWRGGLTAAFALAGIVPLVAGSSTKSSNHVDQVLREAVGENKLPGIVAIVALGDHVIYEGAAGKRDTVKNIPMTVDSIFRIASMTKPITSVAVMQLVESGRVKLDEPASTYLPALSQVQVLEEFDARTGKAKLRPPKAAPTVRQLLSHTSGFAYELFDPKLHDYVAAGAIPSIRQWDDAFLKAPLVFDPGSRWEYGISTDVLGRMVERLPPRRTEPSTREGNRWRWAAVRGDPPPPRSHPAPPAAIPWARARLEKTPTPSGGTQREVEGKASGFEAIGMIIAYDR